MEDKDGFITALNQALIVNGGGRYDHLMEFPLVYMPVIDGSTELVKQEFIAQGGNLVDITGDSLTAILSDLCRAKVI